MSDQAEFHANLETWAGFADGSLPSVMDDIEGVRIQGGYVCLEVLDDDGDEAEYAITIDSLITKTCDFLRNSHPDDAAESKAEMLRALREAIAKIEAC